MSVLIIMSDGNACERALFTFSGKMCDPKLMEFCTKMAEIPGVTYPPFRPFQERWRSFV